MIGKKNLINPYAPSPSLPIEQRNRTDRVLPTALSPNETDHLVRMGRLVGPMLREIQNPVSTLLATSELLNERMAKADPNRGFMRLISQETVRVQEALADLATLAEPMSLTPRDIDLQQLVNDVIDANRVHAKRHGVRIAINIETTSLSVYADRPALRLAIMKLMRNAIEAMSYGGTLNIAIEQVQDPVGSVAQLIVTDEGPRVPPELLARLFQPFMVSPGRRPGIRLALCQMIVERLGGRTNAWNNGEVGLTVEVRLPLS